MQKIIKYNRQDITNDYLSGHWQHPVTGERPDRNVHPLHFEGVTVETLPDPEPIAPEPQPRTWTTLAFLELFSEEKQLAVIAATRLDEVVALWWAKAIAAQEVREDDPRLSAGLAYLVQTGVLSQADIDAALSQEQV